MLCISIFTVSLSPYQYQESVSIKQSIKQSSNIKQNQSIEHLEHRGASGPKAAWANTSRRSSSLWVDVAVARSTRALHEGSHGAMTGHSRSWWSQLVFYGSWEPSCGSSTGEKTVPLSWKSRVTSCVSMWFSTWRCISEDHEIRRPSRGFLPLPCEFQGEYVKQSFLTMMVPMLRGTQSIHPILETQQTTRHKSGWNSPVPAASYVKNLRLAPYWVPTRHVPGWD